MKYLKLQILMNIVWQSEFYCHINETYVLFLMYTSSAYQQSFKSQICLGLIFDMKYGWKLKKHSYKNKCQSFHNQARKLQEH